MSDPNLTTNDAKRIIKAELERLGLPFTKLSARTISFMDLARGSCIFVRIHGWQPNPAWDTLKAKAKAHGFCIET